MYVYTLWAFVCMAIRLHRAYILDARIGFLTVGADNVQQTEVAFVLSRASENCFPLKKFASPFSSSPKLHNIRRISALSRQRPVSSFSGPRSISLHWMFFKFFEGDGSRLVFSSSRTQQNSFSFKALSIPLLIDICSSFRLIFEN